MTRSFQLRRGPHVAALSSAYCNDEMTSSEMRRVAEHLIGCNYCREEFEQVKLGQSFARQLELVAAPASLWSGVNAGLNQPHPAFRFSWRRPLAIAAAVALIIAGPLLWSSLTRKTTGLGWPVARLSGSPRIGPTSISDKGSLGLGQWLETDSNSRARLDVTSVGQVEIDPNTRVRLVESKATEHRLELERGRLSARISAPPKLFFVNTPSAIAADLGCAYTLEVDDDGNSLLRVTSGWVALQLPDRESKVPAGAACATRRGVGLGTPYFEDASTEFRMALTTWDFAPADQKGNALQLLIKDARPRDAMTLWYLLSRVDAAQRTSVYDRLAQLAPPPDGVTRAGVLALDPAMLNHWRDLIDGGDNSAAKGITRWWTRALGKFHALQGKR